MSERTNEDIENWGEVVGLNEVAARIADKTAGPIPVVFHFRPTKFLVVAQDHLKDWERYVAENVGLSRLPQVEDGGYPWTGDPRETISGSAGGWDDCDMM